MPASPSSRLPGSPPAADLRPKLVSKASSLKTVLPPLPMLSARCGIASLPRLRKAPSQLPFACCPSGRLSSRLSCPSSPAHRWQQCDQQTGSVTQHTHAGDCACMIALPMTSAAVICHLLRRRRLPLRGGGPAADAGHRSWCRSQPLYPPCSALGNGAQGEMSEMPVHRPALYRSRRCRDHACATPQGLQLYDRSNAPQNMHCIAGPDPWTLTRLRGV